MSSENGSSTSTSSRTPSSEQSFSWRPSGLLQSLVAEKEVEMSSFAESIEKRPDHPLNLRLAFFSEKASGRLARALKRSDGALAVIGALKMHEMDLLRGEKREYVKMRDPGNVARNLEKCGVDALMFHVDEKMYGVGPLDIERFMKMRKELAREKGLDVGDGNLGVPVIYNDLIVHPLQIAQAAVLGADAVMLIAAAALTDLNELMNIATMMGLEVVVECHTELERDFAVECGATIFYLTNRDRTSGRIVKETAEKLRLNMAEWCVTIGGGGIESCTEAWPLIDAGFDSVVVGRTMMTTRRPEEYISEIQSEQKNQVTEFFRSFGYAGPPEEGK